MITSFLLKKTCIIVTLTVLYNGSAFNIYDAESLLRGSPVVRLTGDEVEEVLNMDVGGEYTTMSFQYEHDQFLGQYDDDKKGERCYSDHVRCLTSILSASRPVCGVTTAGSKEYRAVFGSLCDLYLDNCKRNTTYWYVLDSRNCDKAKNIHIYGYDENVAPIKTN